MNKKHRSILSLTNEKAKSFFLKSSSYCAFALPHYFVFTNLLNDIDKTLGKRNLTNSQSKIKKVRDYDSVNYTLLHNKDGKYAWRPMQLIHPAIYVDLVNQITLPNHWRKIKSEFKKFNKNTNIACMSIPVQSLSKEKDKAEQISRWYQEVEQRSIELALDYRYIFHTDIVDCYGSIYTHSISWALHTKAYAKKKKNLHNKKLTGVVIDKVIQNMNLGQTNGIPQGSILMDLIAEVVLGYADLELSKEIKKTDIKDYFILRYRDDYRIFTNTPLQGEQILKILTETLIDLGMKLNPAKTIFSNDVIRSSIKPDKLHWIEKQKTHNILQKHILIIHNHAKQYPNSGSLAKSLSNFYHRLCKSSLVNVPKIQIISIVVDIAFHNPRTFPTACAILSRLISQLDSDEEKKNICERINKKFQQLPNTGYMQLWFQRVSKFFAKNIEFPEPLTKLVSDKDINIWCSEWIDGRTKLKSLLDKPKIIDKKIMKETSPNFSPSEIDLFKKSYFYYDY